jgi:c-di-AMP phosphodiesterase-like protein
MIKTERDTFVYVFEQKYIKQMETDKFIILDIIKEIKNDQTTITKTPYFLVPAIMLDVKSKTIS